MLVAPLILLPLIATLVALSFRRPMTTKPDHHHWVVRILCAILFVSALIAVGVGTWRGTNEDAFPRQTSLQARTKAPRSIILPKNYHGQKIDIGPSKLIGTVLVVRKVQDRFLPVCGESLTRVWPPTSNNNLAFHGEYAGATYTVTMHLGELVNHGNAGDIYANNCLSIQAQGATWSRTGGTGSLELNSLNIENLGFGQDSLYHAPLSLIPEGNDGDLRLLIHLTRADNDDPLQEIPAAQWLDSHASDRRLSNEQMNSYNGVRSDPNVPPGIRMLAFLGPSAVLLLIAAIAGAHLLRHGRRAYALAGLLALMVLYAGLLDALVLQRRSRLAADSNQPEAARAQALAGMIRGTFFHSGTASSRVRALAADAATPDSLRKFANVIVNE